MRNEDGTDVERGAVTDVDAPPLIGLSGRRTHGQRLDGVHPGLGHVGLDVYFVDYARAVIEAGGLPVHLPLDLEPAAVIGRLDGVVLSGGADVDPARYGRERDAAVDVVEPERDAFELALLDEAFRWRRPVLGICRGLQLVNVHAGGTLHQHVPEHSRYDVPSTRPMHDVAIDADSMLGAMYGATLAVNTMHHQTVDVLGGDLRVTARAPDGTVEGLERADDLLAVQWHPEMMTGRAEDPLFTWIVERAIARRRDRQRA